MLDYTFTNVPAYDGSRRTVRAIEVFNASTGTTIAFCRQRPFEARQTWVQRALNGARMVIA